MELPSNVQYGLTTVPGWTSNDQYIYLGTRLGWINLWNASTAEYVDSVIYDGQIWALDVAPDGTNFIHGGVPNGDVDATIQIDTIPVVGLIEDERIRLTSLCSPDPDSIRIWRVRNTNTDPIDFTWDVVGTDQTGSGTVPGGSEDNPGEVTFETIAVDGPNTTRIFVDGEEQDVKASTPDACTVAGPQIDQLILVDAATDGDLFALTDGMTVDLATLGVSELSVRA
ncbi:MAG: hypothetical protein AAF125_28250, partial [Chloroflexota bacterium]